MPTKGNHDVKEVNYFQWVNFTIKTANKSIFNAFAEKSGSMNNLRAMSASWAYMYFEVSKATVPFDLIVQLLIISIRDLKEQT